MPTPIPINVSPTLTPKTAAVSSAEPATLVLIGLRSFALFRHAGHVTVGFKCDVMSALFEGSHAVLVEYHLVADVVIALLVFFELVSCRLYWRCWARRVIVALLWVLSLHRRRDRQREY